MNWCPSNLSSSSSLSPSLLLVWISILYTCLQCVRRGIWGFGPRQLNTCRKVPLQVILFRVRHLALFSMSLIFLRGCGNQWNFFFEILRNSLSLTWGCPEVLTVAPIVSNLSMCSRFQWFATNFTESSCFTWGQAHIRPRNENILEKIFSLQ